PKRLEVWRQARLGKKAFRECDLRGNDEPGQTSKILGSHAVHAEPRGDFLKRTTRSCDSKPEIMIVTPSRIKPSNALEYSPTHKRGGLKDQGVTEAKRGFKNPCAGNELPVKPPLFIHDARSSEYDVDLLLVLEDFHCRTNSSGRPQIVGVQPGENLAVAELPATVDGVEGSPIRLGQPADPVAVPFEDI